MAQVPTYQKLEDDIVARLKSRLPGRDIIPLPENDEQIAEEFESARVTVAYRGSEYSSTIVRGLPDMLTTSEAAQDDYAEVSIVLKSRLLRGDSGIHKIFTEIRAAILGWSPSNFQRIFFKTFGYESHENGIWCYSLVVVCRGVAMQEFDDDPTNYPLLQDVTINSNI